MKQHSGKLPTRQAGFSLVEIMVGLTIGLLATLVITQVMSVFETQKRVTTGTADAQTNGSISLYTIGRDMKMAGYSLLPTLNSPLECTALTVNGLAGDPASLSPVTIIDGGAGGSDTITIRYGNSQAGGTFSAIGTAPIGNVATVANNFGCTTGDTTLIINGNVCAISRATAVPATGSVGTAIDTSITLQDTTGVAAGANLACLGTWSVITYSVVNGNLNVTTNGGVPAPSMEGIVDLQAQYGISAFGNSNAIVQWVDATNAWAAPTVANRNLIKAVRFAVVARNPKKEANAVTTVCTDADTPGLSGLCAWQGDAISPAPVINLVAGGADWLKYRYRVFETIIPLRNVIWAGGPKGTLQ